MRKFIHSLMIFSLVFSQTVFAQNSISSFDITEGYDSFRNHVINPGAEKNLGSLTQSSAGTVTRSTSAPIEGAASFIFDATATAQTATWTSKAFFNHLKNQNCEAKFSYSGDGTLYKAYVVQNTTKVSLEQQLISVTDATPISLNFACGDLSQTSRLVIESTGNGAAIKIDRLYVGAATNLGQSQSLTGRQAYTPTFTGLGTVSNVEAYWSRIGDSIYLDVKATAGVTTVTEVRATLPNNWVAQSWAQGIKSVGTWFRGEVTSQHGGAVLISSGSQYVVFGDSATFGTASVNALSATTGIVSGTGIPFHFTALIPIQGWTSGAVIAPGSQALQPAGEIMPIASVTCPTGWLTADGSLVSRSTYGQLFTRMGTAWGSGDGSTTFGLPDFRGMFLRGTMSIANVTGTGSAASNNVTMTGHGYNRSGIPIRVTGTPVTGLSTGTTYFAIVVDANTLAFATTAANALAGTKITISGSAASMTVTQWMDPDASSRIASNTGGNTGANVGSVQADELTSHSHNYDAGGNAHFVLRTTGGALGLTTGSVQANSVTGTQSTGGNETRPENANVVYCVRAFDQTSSAPIFVGSVTTPDLQAYRLFSFSVDSAGGVSNDLGDLINGDCTNANPSVCTINSGKVLSLLTCAGSVNGTSTQGSVSTQLSGVSSISVQAWNASGTAVNGSYTKRLICHGF